MNDLDRAWSAFDTAHEQAMENGQRLAVMEAALREIAGLTERRKLPLTCQINDIATKAINA